MAMTRSFVDSANKQDTTSSTSRCAWTWQARRFKDTCQRRCPLECRDGAAMSEHCHQRRTRQLCRLPLQATSPVAAAANDTRLAQGETLGNLRSCKCHRRAAFAHCSRDISAASARAPKPPRSARSWMINPLALHRAYMLALRTRIRSVHSFYNMQRD